MSRFGFKWTKRRDKNIYRLKTRTNKKYFIIIDVYELDYLPVIKGAYLRDIDCKV